MGGAVHFFKFIDKMMTIKNERFSVIVPSMILSCKSMQIIVLEIFKFFSDRP